MRRTKFFFLLVASVFILIQGKTTEHMQSELDSIYDDDKRFEDDAESDPTAMTTRAAERRYMQRRNYPEEGLRKQCLVCEKREFSESQRRIVCDNHHLKPGSMRTLTRSVKIRATRNNIRYENIDRRLRKRTTDNKRWGTERIHERYLMRNTETNKNSRLLDTFRSRRPDHDRVKERSVRRLSTQGVDRRQDHDRLQERSLRTQAVYRRQDREQERSVRRLSTQDVNRRQDHVRLQERSVRRLSSHDVNGRQDHARAKERFDSRLLTSDVNRRQDQDRMLERSVRRPPIQEINRRKDQARVQERSVRRLSAQDVTRREDPDRVRSVSVQQTNRRRGQNRVQERSVRRLSIGEVNRRQDHDRRQERSVRLVPVQDVDRRHDQNRAKERSVRRLLAQDVSRVEDHGRLRRLSIKQLNRRRDQDRSQERSVRRLSIKDGNRRQDYKRRQERSVSIKDVNRLHDNNRIQERLEIIDLSRQDLVRNKNRLVRSFLSTNVSRRQQQPTVYQLSFPVNNRKEYSRISSKQIVSRGGEQSVRRLSSRNIRRDYSRGRLANADVNRRDKYSVRRISSAVVNNGQEVSRRGMIGRNLRTRQEYAKRHLSDAEVRDITMHITNAYTDRQRLRKLNDDETNAFKRLKDSTFNSRKVQRHADRRNSVRAERSSFTAYSVDSEKQIDNTFYTVVYATQIRTNILHKQPQRRNIFKQEAERTIREQIRRDISLEDTKQFRREYLTHRNRDYQTSSFSRRVVPATFKRDSFIDILDYSTLARSFVVGVVALLGTNMWNKSV